MATYRTNIRATTKHGRAPTFPDAGSLRRAGAATLGVRLGAGAGVVGWVAVTWLAWSTSDSFLDGPPAPPIGVVFFDTAPALLTTAWLTERLVTSLALRERPATLVVVFGMLAGVANGLLFAFVEALLRGTLVAFPTAFVTGIGSSVASLPLGLVFGASLAPFVAAASRELEVPTHASRAALRRIAAVFVAGSACVAAILAATIELGATQVVFLGAAPAVLACASAIESIVIDARLRAIRRDVAAGTHPSVTTLPRADSRVLFELAALDRVPGTTDVVLVARADLDAPVHGKPVALAVLTSPTHGERAA